MNKSYLLSTAIGSALAFAAMSASAVTPAPSAGNSLDIGGATATDRTQAESFLDKATGVCADNVATNATISVDVYTNAATWAPASPSTYRIDCIVRAGSLAGQSISVAKFAGGSETGVTTVADGVATIGTNTVVLPNRAGCAAPVATAGGPTFVDYRLFVNCPTTVTVPQVGVSDVEPKLFNITTTTINRLTPNGAAAVPFGIVVSRNLYEALQNAQGLIAGGCPAGGGVGGAGDDTEACAPNLTITQVRALLSQNIFDSNDLVFGGTAIAAPSSADTVLRVCKRADTSGTEQSHELLWFSEGCVDAATLVVKLVDSVDVGGNQGGLVWNAALGAGNWDAQFVFPGRGSGDTESCLDAADDLGFYAVGINSADRSPNDTNREFRYVKVDGYLPNVLNVLEQNYPYYTENTINSPNSTSPNFAAFNTGNRPVIFSEYLLGGLGNAGVLGRSHQVREGMRFGLLARPVDGVNLPAAVDQTAPVNTSTRQVTVAAGTPVDNCVEPVVVQGLKVVLN